MDVERAALLWNRFLSGETLTGVEEQELLETLESDAHLRRKVLDDGRMNGLLSGLACSSRDGEGFAKDFLDYLRAEEDGDRFVRVVRQQLIQGASGCLRPEASRRSFGRGPRGIPPSLLPLSLAGGLLIAGFLFFSFSPSSGHPSRREREKAEETRHSALGRPEALEEDSLAQKAEKERVRATEARQESEGRLAKIREEEEKAEGARRAADAGQEKNLQAEAAFREILRKRHEEEVRLSKLREDEKRAQARQQEASRSTPVPAPEVNSATRVTIASLERIEGEGIITTPGAGRTGVRGGEGLLPGQGLETVGENSRGVLVYSDKTRVEIGPDTDVRDLEIEGGKRLLIVKGSVTAKVSKQPAGQPMIFATPHGEAKVVGTTLRLHVDPDPKKGTRLEVEEGKVELKNLSRKTVTVESGRYVVAAAGVEFVARRRSPTVTSPVTLGEAAVLGTDDFGNGNILLAQGVTLDRAATLESLSFYVTQARGRLRLGVYDAGGAAGGPGRKLAETAEFTPGLGWNTVAVAPIGLAVGNYWLAYLPNDSNLRFRVERGTGTEAHYPHAYGPMPSTFSTTPTINSAHWSFFATLNTP